MNQRLSTRRWELQAFVTKVVQLVLPNYGEEWGQLIMYSAHVFTTSRRSSPEWYNLCFVFGVWKETIRFYMLLFLNVVKYRGELFFGTSRRLSTGWYNLCSLRGVRDEIVHKARAYVCL